METSSRPARTTKGLKCSPLLNNIMSLATVKITQLPDFLVPPLVCFAGVDESFWGSLVLVKR